MVKAVASTETAEPRESAHPQTGVVYRVTDFIGTSRAEHAPGPQAFLTDVLTPNGVIRPHFHTVDGFHVITAGEGTVGKQPLRYGTIHYTDAYTPYGPIAAGPDGIGILEFRNAHTATSHYMPDSRDELRGRKAGRNIVVDVRLDPAARPDAGRFTSQTLIEPQPDGLAAYLVSAGGGARVAGELADAAGARYYVVASGNVAYPGKTLDPWSCIFVGAGEPPPSIVAGPAGADVMVLQFGHERPNKGNGGGGRTS
jgi:hypothetical protein